MESITGMDGARITFEVHGDGPHKIVLFFRHFPWIEWGYVKAQPEFAFLIVDPRGHGESSHFDDRSLYGLWTGALDVLTAADAAGFESFIIWGFSQGAIRAASLARKSHRVKALICGGYQLLDCALPQARFRSLEEEAAKGKGSYRDGALFDFAESIVLFEDLAAWTTIEQDLRDLTCPRLLYFGSEDVFAESIRQRTSRLEECGFKVLEISGLDHETGLSRIDIVAPHIREFLSDSGIPL